MADQLRGPPVAAPWRDAGGGTFQRSWRVCPAFVTTVAAVVIGSPSGLWNWRALSWEAERPGVANVRRFGEGFEKTLVRAKMWADACLLASDVEVDYPVDGRAVEEDIAALLAAVEAL